MKQRLIEIEKIIDETIELNKAVQVHDGWTKWDEARIAKTIYETIEEFERAEQNETN